MSESFTVSIDAPALQLGVPMFYTLRMRYVLKPGGWSTKRRYSDFEMLVTALRSELDLSPPMPLPRKHIMPLQPELDKRAVDLEVFLTGLIECHPEVLTSEAARSFFDLDGGLWRGATPGQMERQASSFSRERQPSIFLRNPASPGSPPNLERSPTTFMGYVDSPRKGSSDIPITTSTTSASRWSVCSKLLAALAICALLAVRCFRTSPSIPSLDRAFHSRAARAGEA